LERSSLVFQIQFWLRNKWTLLQFEFDLQAFLIDRFKKAAALFLVDLKTCTDNA